MDSLVTPSNIMFVFGLLSILFAIYHYFKNPQIDSDKKDALFAQQIQYMSDANERRFKDVNESAERRFKDIHESFQALLLQSNNHIHTVDTKVDNVGQVVAKLDKEIIKLATIINERIPKNQSSAILQK